MDRIQILTVVITVVATVVAEALLRGLLSAYKGARPVRLAREWLRRVFSKPNRAVLTESALLVINLGSLASVMTAEGAPQRWEIGLMIFMILATLFLTFSILFRISLARVRKEERERKLTENKP